jgi:hypothetical protein
MASEAALNTPADTSVARSLIAVHCWPDRSRHSPNGAAFASTPRSTAVASAARLSA